MPRKLPLIDHENAAFWQGGESGRLMIHRCTRCARWFHPPAAICPHCRSSDVQPQPVSGAGVILSFTINHQAWTPELTQPYVIAIVELEEQAGLRLLTNIVDAPPASIRIGQRVQVRFLHEEDVWLPVFAPLS